MRFCFSPCKRIWYRYLLPRRLTMKVTKPAIYRWLVWNFTLVKEGE